MKVEHVTPFVSSAVSVFQTLLSIEPTRGNLSARPQLFTTQQINVLCGVTGPVEGQIIYSMSLETALGIASKMIGQEVASFDALTASAIAELGNMICGNAMQLLSQTGLTCDITPPTIMRGTNIRIASNAAATLVVPITVGHLGSIDINVSLSERKVARLAS